VDVHAVRVEESVRRSAVSLSLFHSLCLYLYVGQNRVHMWVFVSRQQYQYKRILFYICIKTSVCVCLFVRASSVRYFTFNYVPFISGKYFSPSVLVSICVLTQCFRVMILSSIIIIYLLPYKISWFCSSKKWYDLVFYSLISSIKSMLTVQRY